MQQQTTRRGRTVRTVNVTDGNTTEQCRIEETKEYRGTKVSYVEGDTIEGWVELPETTPQLDCTRCEEFHAFEREQENVVRCENCGKRHSNDSLYDVPPLARFDRDKETGELVNPPRRAA
jgi:hypothetical protein